MSDNFERELDKKQKELDRAVGDIIKEKEREKDEFHKREKELMKKI